MRRAALKPEGGRPGEKRDATASFRVGGASGLAVLPIRGEGARPGQQVWAEKAQASGDSENGTRGRRAPPQRGLRQVGRRPRAEAVLVQTLHVKQASGQASLKQSAALPRRWRRRPASESQVSRLRGQGSERRAVLCRWPAARAPGPAVSPG